MNTERFFKLDSRIFTKSENDGKGTWHAKIAAGLSAPRNDNKKESVIANAVKQSRQTLYRHPDENQDLVKSLGHGKIAAGLAPLAMTSISTCHPRRMPGIQRAAGVILSLSQDP